MFSCNSMLQMRLHILHYMCRLSYTIHMHDISILSYYAWFFFSGLSVCLSTWEQGDLLCEDFCLCMGHSQIYSSGARTRWALHLLGYHTQYVCMIWASYHSACFVHFRGLSVCLAFESYELICYARFHYLCLGRGAVKSITQVRVHTEHYMC